MNIVQSSMQSLRVTTRASALLALTLGTTPAPADAAPDSSLAIIPHTHWEGAVFKTRQEYLDVGLPHIVQALQLMQRYPQYTFVLDQMSYIKPFLDRYPELTPEFAKVLREHRLEIAGGTLVMEDENIPSGESIAHHFLLSKQYFRERLGYEVSTGWGLDTFGHNAQMPQILSLSGIKNYWFSRGVASARTPSEILWQGIDGTSLPARWLPLGYSVLPEHIPNFPRFQTAVEAAYDGLTPSMGVTRDRVLLEGLDVSEPDESLPPYVQQWTASTSMPFSLRFETPFQYDQQRSQARRDRPTLPNPDLNPIFPGGYSTRIELKRWMRDMEGLLGAAESASVLANRLTDIDRQSLERAWDPTLFNQTHDISSGVMLDHVYEDVVAGYRDSQRRASELLAPSLDEVLSNADTRGDGIALAIFNFSGWARSDYVETTIDFSTPGIRHIRLKDSDGKEVPVQILQYKEGGNGLQSATICFIAREVPSMGFSIYHVVSSETDSSLVSNWASPGPPLRATSTEEEGVLENDQLKVTVDLWTGAMLSLRLKDSSHWEALSSPGNVVAREDDRGDLWELNGTLDGARLIAEKRPIGLPIADRTLWSDRYIGGAATLRSGTVMSEFGGAHPLGKNMISIRIRVYPELRRVDVHTEITNQEPFVRYRVLFPTTIHEGTNIQSIPFGSISRPKSTEFPAQYWVDYGSKGHGLALLNRGLPGNNVVGDTMMISLLRSTRLQVYGDTESGYDPAALPSDTALELGKRIVHDYALLPHAGTWKQAQVFRAGYDFNHPLIARTAPSHSGKLGSRWGFLNIGPGSVVVTALKPSRGNRIALRLHEAAGDTSSVTLSIAPTVQSAAEGNLLEDATREIPTNGHKMDLNLHPFEIKTVLLQLAPN